MNGHNDGAAMPVLRYRTTSGDHYFEKPVSIVGHIVGLDFHSLTIGQGRLMTTKLALEDLTELLGGPEMAMGLLLDAALHEDLVKIKLTHERITYDNPEQYERMMAAP
jgi:hypothetical protein